MSKGKPAAPQTESAARPTAENGVAMYGRWVPVKVEGLAGVKHTLDLTTEEGKAALVAAGSPGDLEVPEDGRLRMTVCDVAIFWDSEVDEETGEVSEFIRTCFYDESGRTFRTSSPHAPHFIARIIDVYGETAFRDGVPITVSSRPSKQRGRKYHDFRVDLQARRSVGEPAEDVRETPF